MKSSLFVLGLVLVVAPATAQVKDLAEIDMRLGPPNFGPAGGTNCSSPFVPIPDRGQVSDTMIIADTTTIIDLDVLIQARHTWCGDLVFELMHDDTGTSATLIDRPGGGFGCSGDDYDVVLNDAHPNSVDEECAPTVPAIAGDLYPFPHALGAFNGESIGGSWTMTVADDAGGDTGSLDTWCVDHAPPGGDGGPPVGDGGPPTPATSTWGVIALVALFAAVSLFYLRKQNRSV